MGKVNSTNVSAIGDTHFPFEHEDYFDFCKDVYDQFSCTHVVFMGDIIDNHFSSFYDTDPDGYGAGEELKRAIDRLKRWHKAFPNAEVCIGNHDRIAARRLFHMGVSLKWLRELKDVLEVPSWWFDVSFTHDGVKYVHGDKGPTARGKAQRYAKSHVQGHRHSESYVWHNPESRTFGMQVGCGISEDSYAMAYGKDIITPALSVGVILDKGTLPLVIPMI